MTKARDLLLHPVRLRVVQALIGNPMSPLQLKAQLKDVAQATLYRHIKLLADGGLIEVVEERRIRGGVERTYQVVTSAVSMGADEFAGATADDHFLYFVTFLGTLLNDFGAYLDGGSLDLVKDRVGYRQVPLWLTDEEFDEVAREMSEAVRSRLDRTPDGERRRRLFTSVVMPDDRSVPGAS